MIRWRVLGEAAQRVEERIAASERGLERRVGSDRRLLELDDRRCQHANGRVGRRRHRVSARRPHDDRYVSVALLSGVNDGRVEAEMLNEALALVDLRAQSWSRARDAR